MLGTPPVVVPVSTVSAAPCAERIDAGRAGDIGLGVRGLVIQGPGDADRAEEAERAGGGERVVARSTAGRQEHVRVGLDRCPVDERPGVLDEGDGGGRGRDGRGAQPDGAETACGESVDLAPTTTSLSAVTLAPRIDVGLDGLFEDVGADGRIDRCECHAAGDGGPVEGVLPGRNQSETLPAGRSTWPATATLDSS